MKEHPLLFSGEMIRAILEGRKTQTRRVFSSRMMEMVKAAIAIGECSDILGGDPISEGDQEYLRGLCPYAVGDYLWGRETWAPGDDAHNEPRGVVFRATDPGWDENETGLKWKPSIFMPRWASRITLEVEAIRADPVNAISEEDAKAEGAEPSIVGADLDHLKYRTGFQTLWNSINEKRGFPFESGPLVWAYTFKKL